jgi:hypothetical protein
MSKTISIKLEGNTLNVIESIAKKECRSTTQQVRKIIKDYAFDNRSSLKHSEGHEKEGSGEENAF